MKIREVAKHSPLQEGAIADKVIPGIGFADIGIRAAQDDYPGAAIAGTAAGLGLIPTPITRGASIGLDVFNQLRDLAKERGGWGNLGRDIYQSIKTQEYDPSFLPEEFARLDQLDRRGQLDEGGVRDIFTKYGPEAYQWLKKAVTGKKPDVPAPKADSVPVEKPKIVPKPGETPAQAIERAKAEKLAADAAAAEKAAADTAAAERAAEQDLFKRKRFETQKQHLDRIAREGGPEAVERFNQQLNTRLKMRELERGTITGAAKEFGKKNIRYRITMGRRRCCSWYRNILWA